MRWFRVTIKSRSLAQQRYTAKRLSDVFMAFTLLVDWEESTAVTENLLFFVSLTLYVSRYDLERIGLDQLWFWTDNVFPPSSMHSR